MPEKYRRPHSHERVQAVERMKRDWEAQRQALATVRRFNAAKGKAWFWPKIAAALVSKHHWLVIACDSCDTVVDLDLRVKPRDPEASIRVALRDVQCPRCNGHGGRASWRWRSIRRFLALSRHRLTVRNHLSARIECASLARGDRCARTRSAGIRRRVDRRHRAHRCGRSRAAPGNAGRAGVRSSSQAQSDPGRSVACFRLFRFRRKRPAACL